MIICGPSRVIYLAPPKTGTGAIVRTLTPRPYQGVPQDRSYSYHNTVWEDRFQDWFIFITTRHPYTRAVSYWQFLYHQLQITMRHVPHSETHSPDFWVRSYRGKPPTFMEFWDVYPHKEHQTTLWRASWHLEQIPRQVDRVIHQENLQEEFNRIPLFRDCRLATIHPATRTNRPWHSHYTPELIARVHEYWGQDFAAFGYNPDFEACVRGEFFTAPSSS